MFGRGVGCGFQEGSVLKAVAMSGIAALGAQVSEAAESLPLTHQHREALVAARLHMRLRQCRYEAVSQASDACALELLSEADRLPWEALVGDVDDDLRIMELALPNDVQFLLRLFFRMVHAVRRSREKGALMAIVWSLPSIIGPMPPMALSVSSRSARRGCGRRATSGAARAPGRTEHPRPSR